MGNSERVRAALDLYGYQLEGGRFIREFILQGIPLFGVIMVTGLIIICFIETGDDLEVVERERQIEKLKAARKIMTYENEKLGEEGPNTFRGVARTETNSIRST